jgi:hypothetical protein
MATFVFNSSALLLTSKRAVLAALAVPWVLSGCGVGERTSGAVRLENPTAAQILLAASAAMDDVTSLVVNADYYTEGVEYPDFTHEDPDFTHMIIEAKWVSSDQYWATLKPPYNNKQIEIITVQGVSNARWVGQEFNDGLGVSLSNLTYGVVPELVNPRMLTDDIVDGEPASHIVGTMHRTGLRDEDMLTFDSTVGLHISMRTHRLLLYRSRTTSSDVEAMPESAATVEVKEVRYSQLNSEFTIEAPTIPDPTPLPAATPTPTPPR